MYVATQLGGTTSEAPRSAKSGPEGTPAQILRAQEAEVSRGTRRSRKGPCLSRGTIS